MFRLPKRTATATFSLAVMFENGFGIWCVLARPYPTTLFAWRLSILLLSSFTTPEVGFSSPAMMLSSVDFPEPFGPIRPRTADSGRSNEESDHEWLCLCDCG